MIIPNHIQDNIIEYLDFKKILDEKTLNQASVYFCLSKTKLQFAASNFLNKNQSVVEQIKENEIIVTHHWLGSSERNSFLEIQKINNELNNNEKLKK